MTFYDILFPAMSSLWSCKRRSEFGEKREIKMGEVKEKQTPRDSTCRTFSFCLKKKHLFEDKDREKEEEEIN